MSHTACHTDATATHATRRLSPFVALTLLRNAFELARQRRHLATLDARRLDDIGLTRQAALAESRRPFWDAPRRRFL